jgi:PAS domain S-box-containing protein
LTVSEFIDAQRGLIIERWLHGMAALVAPGKHTREELVDNLPLFLEELSSALRQLDGPPGTSRLPGHSMVAEAHGQQRLRLGLDVGVIVREYALLREVLLALLTEAGMNPTEPQVRLLARCIDTGAAEAVSRYVRDEDRAPRESEEHFRRMVNAVQDYGLFVVTPEGTVSGWNPGAERLKGYTTEEAIGMHLDRFFPREAVERGEVRRLLAQAREKDGGEYEGWMVRKDRSTFWATLILDPIRDEAGQLKGFANIARDLTERKGMELAQTLLAEAGEALAGSLDMETIAQRMAQLATPELADWCVVSLVEGPHLLPVAVAHADEARQPLLQRVVRPLPVESSLPHGPVQVVRRGRSELIPDAAEALWLAEALGVRPAEALAKLGRHQALCVPLKTRGATFGAMTFVVEAAPPRIHGPTDVGLAETLAHRVALALDNARLYAEALRRADFERHLVGIVSHDLITPLSAISLSTEMLLKDRDLTPRQCTGLGRIDSSVQRARRLIRDLLDFTQARLGEGIPVRPQTLELHGLTRTVLEEIASANPARQLRITSAGDTRGSWDPDRLAQVLTNLVNNALSYSPPDTPVRVEVLGEGEAVLLRIHNEGEPIPAELLPRLFEPLERGALPGHGGRSIGLGLFIVNHIVRAHGGAVEVRSEPHEGTTFTVRLPRDR